jgi:amidohydrolase
MMPTVKGCCAMVEILLSRQNVQARGLDRGGAAMRRRLPYHADVGEPRGVRSDDPDEGRPCVSDIKTRIVEAVETLAPELEALSHRIHAHPELGFQEVLASGWLAEFLGARGFHVERGVAGVPTAFRATIDAGPGPCVAVLCEYDALPGIGHACGHNVIAAAGAGAGAALAAVRDRLPGGRIEVIGTPAEEGGGGKVKLIQGGAFERVDCAMMIHGFDRNLLHQDLLGVTRVQFEFAGKAAHASVDPWAGINALDACIQTFTGVAMLRQQMRPDCRIHGIVTDGGLVENVIPERAAAIFSVRAPTIDEMWDLHRRVVACAEGAARATGAGLEVTPRDVVYEPMNSSAVLMALFGANMRAVGLPDGDPIPDRVASSDIGNVSQVVPTIHPWIAIAPEGMAIHTREFRDAAAGPLARAGLLAGAKALAMTAVDLLAEPSRVAEARAALARRRPAER